MPLLLHMMNVRMMFGVDVLELIDKEDKNKEGIIMMKLYV